MCYVHNQRHSGDKFETRSNRYIFIGYTFGKKGWKVYNLDTGVISVSRDVFFIETKFPYADTPPISTMVPSASSSPPVDLFEELFDLQPVSPSVSLETQPPPSTTPEPSSPTPHTSTVDAIPAPTPEQETTQHKVVTSNFCSPFGF